MILLQALAQDQKAALENLLRCCSGLEHVNVGFSVDYTILILNLSQRLLRTTGTPRLSSARVCYFPGRNDLRLFNGRRIDIRETSSVIFTNFVRHFLDSCLLEILDALLSQDMLHASILPHEELWRTCELANQSPVRFDLP